MPETNLNPEQQKAITHGEGPLLIIAGAGTGKTTVITKRIEHLIKEKNVSPNNILALTFTEKAASEMETRIDQVLPYGYSSMWIETFHAFCDRILRQEAIHIGLDPKYEMMTEAQTLLFLRKHLFEFELTYYRPLGNPMKFLQGMLQHFARLKDDDITPEQYLNYAKDLEKKGAEQEEIQKTVELAKAFKRYEELKQKNSVMDFSDLISNTLKLFRTRKNVLTEYQKMFEYILVDEFQDTNYAQNEMAILLSGEKQNITVVGDDDQSIYRWRGAALANMMQFRSHFPKAEIIALTKNYRSTQGILDSSYRLIQHNNPDRLEVKEGIDKKLQAMRDIQGEGPFFLLTNRVEEEAEQVVAAIREEVKKSGRAYNDFAILVRANDHAIPFQRALERAHIPHQFLGPGHLFEQEEIKDLIAYLHTLANYEDTSSLYRVLTMPIFDLSARDIAALLIYSKKQNLSLFETMEKKDEVPITDDGKEKVERIITMIKKHLEKVPHETAGQLLYYFFEDSGLLGHYLDPQSPRTEREAQNIAKLFEKLQSYAANNTDASVFAVTDWIDLSMELGESPMAAEVDWVGIDAVNILTVHSSKGLEFPVVFIVNAVSQRFPSRDRKEQIPVPTDLIREDLPEGNANLEEERRLFYVAMTRAKDVLYITASRFYGEAKRAKKLSPFIAEALGTEYVEKIERSLKAEQTTEQLSLLDIMNTTIQNAKTPEPQAKTKSSGVKLTYVSYSQLQTFEMCPLHYKLRYLLNVPSPASPALSYGVSVHGALRDFYQQRMTDPSLSPETIHTHLKKNWLKDGYASRQHEEQSYQQADQMLKAFITKSMETPFQTIAIEHPFNFWLGKVKVGGRIDRIDKLPDGRIEIIDYKTGTNVPNEKKVKEDFQLTFYALAATEIKDQILNRSCDEIILSLYYLDGNIKLSTVRTKEELEIAKEKILRKVEEIEQSEFICTGSIFCKKCEYSMLCQTFTN